MLIIQWPVSDEFNPENRKMVLGLNRKVEACHAEHLALQEQSNMVMSLSPGSGQGSTGFTSKSWS